MMKKIYYKVFLICLFSLISNISNGQIIAGDDVYYLLGAPCNVLSNDTLNGLSATPTNVFISNISDPQVQIDSNGALSFFGVSSGVFIATYQICETANPSNCYTATITIYNPGVIDAIDDNFTGVDGSLGASAGSVLINDFISGIPISIAQVVITMLTTSSPNVTLAPNGIVVVAPGTPAGIYTLTYQICETLSFINCDVATVTIQVTAPTFCWKDISAGGQFTVAINSDGSLWTWGDNTFSQLGDGTNISTNTPIRVGTDTDWLQVSSGKFDVLALKTDGTLWTWGYNLFGEAGIGTNVIVNIPTKIGLDNDWKIISSGALSSSAIKNNGTLWTWGYNNRGQIGDGTTTDRWIPTQVGISNDWKSVASGEGHTLALKTDNTIWTWGYNVLGQLGDGTNSNRVTPGQIAPGTTWRSISTNNIYCMAIRSDGTLWSWGQNTHGELGDGTNIDRNIPTQIGTANNWQSIAAGGFHSVAKKSDGTLWSWGYNFYGAVGNGTNMNTNSPSQMGLSTDWALISAGNEHTIALKTDGLWAWGYNYAGQLGNATNTDQNVAVLIGCATLDTNSNQTVSNGFLIYPNPTNDILIVESNSLILTTTIYDVNGRVMLSTKEKNNLIILDLKTLGSGIYFLNVSGNNGSETKKIIKQ